jgi:hypothetical protein
MKKEINNNTVYFSVNTLIVPNVANSIKKTSVTTPARIEDDTIQGYESKYSSMMPVVIERE